MNLPPFRNLELTDFSQPENRAAMEAAIARVRAAMGREYDIIVGGEGLKTRNKFDSVNPSHPEEVVGVFQEGPPDLVDPIMSAAEEAFRSWSRTRAEERVKLVLAVADRMREQRLELAAWMVLEVGKSWVEADADVAEAVDFCEFYGREMLRLSGPQPLVAIETEENELRYLPLGVGIIIAPWNFPLAILTGMSMAAVVAGNTIVMKPSHPASAVGAQLSRICNEVGIPAGVVNFVTGGREIGEPLVGHPRTRFLAFTGSKEVGLRLNELAARPQPGQLWIKRVVAEMGGKDAIVVDSDADLDDAVSGVVASTFGYQGQKCSACSRAIVVDAIYDEFVRKLKAKAESSITTGNVERPEVNFGPMVDEGALRKVLHYVKIGREEGRLLVGGEKGSEEGFFVQPTIFVDVKPDAAIAQEEIFGPVLAVIRARDFEHALEIANNTEYGLTGAVYSHDPAKLEKARQEFHVGNLYFNRKCTGALVGVHPFGGFNMSGTDSKAGGRDYLLLFTQAKAIAQKLETASARSPR